MMDAIQLTVFMYIEPSSAMALSHVDDARPLDSWHIMLYLLKVKERHLVSL